MSKLFKHPKSCFFCPVVAEYCKMLSLAPPSPKCGVFGGGTVSASLCVSLLIFRLQKDMDGRE